MKQKIKFYALFGCVALLLSACGPIGDKSVSLSLAYGVIAILSLLLLIGYCFMIQNKQNWLLLLFAAVAVVNAGYYTLSVSKSLSEALLCHRISYLGSVFLPLSMFMAILESCKIRCPRWLIAALVTVSFLVFFVAASPGYSDIYYRSVTMVQKNGITVLEKEYGSWHILYLFYLFAYFASMLFFILLSAKKRKKESTYHSVFLLVAVGVNICVWLMEQLVCIDFEFLSVSYIISELFMLSLFLLMQERNSNVTKEAPPEITTSSQETPIPAETSNPNKQEDIPPCQNDRQKAFADNIRWLTHTERTIYDLYIEGKSTKQIMEILSITENTLKFHNKNIYGKLGVSSRKQLLEIAVAISNSSKPE